MMNVGIIGSWLIDDGKFIYKQLDMWLDEELKTTNRNAIRILRTNSKGFNQYITVWCKSRLIDDNILYPLIQNKRMSYRYATIEVMAMSDKIIAFDDSRSTSTAFIINYAKLRNKNIRIIRYQHEVTK